MAGILGIVTALQLAISFLHVSELVSKETSQIVDYAALTCCMCSRIVMINSNAKE